MFAKKVWLLIITFWLPLSLLEGKQERPNIIVFLVDDYDKPETSPYGGKVLTPNLDRLAREGMIVTIITA